MAGNTGFFSEKIFGMWKNSCNTSANRVCLTYFFIECDMSDFDTAHICNTIVFSFWQHKKENSFIFYFHQTFTLRIYHVLYHDIIACRIRGKFGGIILRFFKNRLKSILLLQFILGIVAVLFVIVSWVKDFHPGYMLVGMIILGIMLVMNGLEQFFLYKMKGYLFFTIVVSAAYILLWIWRYSIAIKFY